MLGLGSSCGSSTLVVLGPGQLYVVPHGVQHQAGSVDGAEVLQVVPSVTISTGDTRSELTAGRRIMG